MKRARGPMEKRRLPARRGIAGNTAMKAKGRAARAGQKFVAGRRRPNRASHGAFFVT